MSVAPPNSQGIRSVNISNLTPAPPTAAETVYVDIYTDPKTKQECILWEDIQPAFYNALHVRHKARIVPFVKDSNLETLEPFRIAVIPGEVLDVVVGNPYDTFPQQQHQHQQHQQASVLRQIEQQAARLPRHNPFSTMRPISSTHPFSSLQNARFAPPENNFTRTVSSSKQQLDCTAIHARNEELANQYASEAMVKVAAKMDLDTLHAKGDGAPGDFWKALECYLKGVRQSHAHAQFTQTFHKADLGDATAQVLLGKMYEEGTETARDDQAALTWYLKAAAQNDAQAQLNIGALYHFGRVNPPDRDFVKALEWYLKAARQGHAAAQYHVGFLYHHGPDGVPLDYVRAQAWYLKSAQQNYTHAERKLGYLYCENLVEVFEKAVEFYERGDMS